MNIGSLRMTDLRINLLGPPQVTVGSEPLVVDTRKAVALLSFLASAEGPVARDSLSFLLWPDYSRDRSRAALRRTLSSLRKGLGDEHLQADRQEVGLVRASEVFIDVSRFEELTGNGGSRASLEEAARLVRGDFMEGFGLRDSAEFDDWQMNQAAAYRRRAASLWDQLTGIYAGEGEWAQAIETSIRWLELDPLHEEAHRQLMRLYAWSGDRPAALNQYRSCVRVLEEQLGVPPLDETTDLYRAVVDDRLPPAEITSRQPAVQLLQEKRSDAHFVGRAAEMNALHEALVQAKERGLVATITGEPGIGKTRLVDEFLQPLDRETINHAQGHRGEGNIPYGVVIELIRNEIERRSLDGIDPAMLAEISRLLPELKEHLLEIDPGPVDSPGGHRRFLEAVTGFLLGDVESATTVISVDDIQWVDSETVDLLIFMAHHSQGPALLLLSYRTGADGRPLLRFDRGTEVIAIDLDRLNNDEIAQLIEAEAPDEMHRLDELIELTEGVPYFLVEYLAALDEDGTDPVSPPTGVLDLLEERIEGISDLGRQILSTAAVIGRSFRYRTLAQVSGRSDDETVQGLEELLADRIVHESAGTETFDFDHEQLRRLAYERTNAPRRTLLHSRLADELLQGGPADGRVAAIAADHLRAAGRDAEAAEQYVRAADRAAALYANARAIKHYEAALALGHPDDSRIRGALGVLYALEGNYPDALASLEAAAAVSEGLPLASLEHRLGMVHVRAGDLDLAEARFEAAEDGFNDDPVAKSRLLADWSAAVSRKGDATRARELAAGALSDATITGDPLALAQAHNTLGIVERVSDPTAARKHHETSLALVQDMSPTVRAAALNNLALAHLSGGDPEGGLEYGLEALELCERVGDRHKGAAVHNNLADLLHAAGRDDEAMDHLVQAVKLFSDIDDRSQGLQPQIWMLTEW